MSANNITHKIKFEIKQINKLLQDYKKLIEDAERNKPDINDIAALAAILHSFYNGVENIFSLIAKNIDEDYDLSGDRWHKDLLNQMVK